MPRTSPFPSLFLLLPFLSLPLPSSPFSSSFHPRHWYCLRAIVMPLPKEQKAWKVSERQPQQEINKKSTSPIKLLLKRAMVDLCGKKSRVVELSIAERHCFAIASKRRAHNSLWEAITTGNSPQKKSFWIPPQRTSFSESSTKRQFLCIPLQRESFLYFATKAIPFVFRYKESVLYSATKKWFECCFPLQKRILL